MEVEDLLTLVESNKPSQIEDIKKKIYDQFNSTKEAWLLNGIFDCYVQTSSMRLVEILVGVREPHDRHLFDKLSETLRGQSKLQALTLLGHVVRRHPTWLIKITQHQLLKDLFRTLKMETDILLLMSALLVIIILLPMIPSLMANHLQEIFDVFSRLAAWNTNNPNKVPEENLLHLQVGLCELFHRLYGMYPCNFLFYLRHQYSQREHLDVFSHTIKPMVCSVRMHPLLVTASKDAETAASRWKKMEDHDVIVECAKFVLDAATRDEPCSSLRSRSATDNISTHDSVLSAQQLSERNMAAELALTYSGRPLPDIPNDFASHFSPSVHCGLNTPPPQESAPTSIPHTPVSQSYVVSSSFPHQEGTSPPEAAIEATPETTPIKDLRHMSRHPPVATSVMRALNHSLSSASGSGSTTGHKWPGGLSVSVSTTSYSQPSSPMKKEPSPFRYSGMGVNVQLANAATPPPVLSSLATPPPAASSENFSSASAFQQHRRDSLPMGGSALLDQNWEPTSINRRVASLVQDRKQVLSDSSSDKQSSGGANTRPRGSITSASSNMQVPSSPLRVIPRTSSSSGIPPESPIPIEPTAPVPGSRDWPVTRPTPEFKNGLRLESIDSNRTFTGVASPYSHHPHQSDSTQEDQEVVEIVRQGEQYRNDSQPINVQHQTPTSNRQCDSVLQEFSAAHSQDHECELDGDECQQEASGSPCASGGLHMPNSVMNFTRRVNRLRYYSQCLPTHHLLPDASAGSTGSSPGEGSSFPLSTRVRRANSCPEMEKAQALLPGTDVKVHRTVEEREEFEDAASSEEAITPQNSIGEEVIVNGCGHPTPAKEMKSEGTQTMDCAPYEHLFMSVFSPIESRSSPAQSPPPMSVPVDCHMFPHKLSPQAQLDQYLARVVENRSQGSSSDSDVRLLKEQVMLLHIQLQFERQRREIHAERNRRLLGRSRNNRALEEHRNALKEQLGLLQRENEQLHDELSRVRHESRQREQDLQDSIRYWQEECNRAQKNWRESKLKSDAMEQQLSQEREQTAAVQKDLQHVQAKLFDASNEVRQAAASAAAAERLRMEVQHLQRELLLAGEQHQRFRDRMQHLAVANNRAEETASLKEAYHEELHNLHQLLDTKSSALDAAKARVAELESSVNRAASVVGEQKSHLKCVKDEYNDQLQAVESKYQTQKKINQKLQEENLELLQKRDIAELRCRARKRDGREPSASQPAAASSHTTHPKSPDSVCSDDRLPHSSSPLSESLSSSEGMSLSGILARDMVTLQNLQVIVDQPEASDTIQISPTPSSPSKSTTVSSNPNHNPRDEG